LFAIGLPIFTIIAGNLEITVTYAYIKSLAEKYLPVNPANIYERSESAPPTKADMILPESIFK